MQFTKALQHTIGWKALNTILTFFINLLLVRILGADGSGEFFYSIAVLSFFTLLISWSMESGITYYGSNNQDGIPSIILFIMPWLMLQAVVSWGLLHFITVNMDRRLSLLFVLSNLMIIYFSALFYAKKWFISINIIVLAVNVIVLVGLGLVYAKYGNEPHNLLHLLKEKIARQHPVVINNFDDIRDTKGYYFATITYFGGLLLQAFALGIVFYIQAGFKIVTPVFKPLLISNIFRYSSIAFISNILFFLVTRIDYYFVQKYCGEIALSNYVQVSKMGQLLVLLPTMMAGVIFPYSTGANDKDYLGKLQSLCRVVGLLLIAAAFTIILGGYWLFPLLFGEGFTMMYPAMLFYLPGFYCLGLVILLAAHLAGRALLTKNMIASGISLVAVITGDILLIPAWGINAAAAVSSLGYFLCMVYLLWVYKKIIGCSPVDFFVNRRRETIT